MANDGTTTASGSVRLFSDAIVAELGRRLVEAGKVSREQINDLNTRSTLTGESLDGLLVKESLVPEAEVLRTMSQITNIPFRSLAEFAITRETIAKVPARAALSAICVQSKLCRSRAVFNRAGRVWLVTPMNRVTFSSRSL